MLKRGGDRDHDRAAVRFVKWWREEGSALSASAPSASSVGGLDAPPSTSSPAQEPPLQRGGWGFDFDWEISGGEPPGGSAATAAEIVQQRMERTIDDYIRDAEADEEDGGMSATQERKRAKGAMLAKKAAKYRARLLARKG